MRSDAELVRAVRDGKTSAYADLVHRHRSAVFATAFRILRDHHAAEDVSQDVFVIAHRKLGTLQDAARFGAWLLTITQRESVRRSQKREHLPQQLVDHVAQPNSSDGESFSDELLAAIADLPEHERIVVVLRHVDGYSIKDISAMTGRPFGTVSKQISRALERLKHVLEEVVDER